VTRPPSLPPAGFDSVEAALSVRRWRDAALAAHRPTLAYLLQMALDELDLEVAGKVRQARRDDTGTSVANRSAKPLNDKD